MTPKGYFFNAKSRLIAIWGGKTGASSILLSLLAPPLACKAEKRLRDFVDFHNPQMQAL
jgi:hypothetical protein